jgi:transcriptional regulator with XRE-family HTH domain
MTLYERIRKLRLDAGLTQDDLAQAMGYKDRSMITKIESGKVDISQKKVVAFAKVLNTTPAYLMGWTDDEDSSEVEKSEEPKNDSVRLLINGLNRLSPEQIEQATEMMRVMFAKTHPNLFDEKGTDEDANT